MAEELGKALTLGQMVTNTSVNGKTTKNMDKALILSVRNQSGWEKNTSVNTNLAEKMGKVPITMQTATNTSVSSKTDKRMDKVSTHSQMAR